MRRSIIFLWLFSTVCTGNAQLLSPVEKSSEIRFAIKNVGLKTTGTFGGLQGKIWFDKSQLPASFFDVSIEAASVNTGSKARDNHLKREDYFDVETHPTIHFKSTGVSSVREGEYAVSGHLTIKGITKTITFPFTTRPVRDGYLFTGSFSIDRTDFKIGGNSWLLGDKVWIDLKIFVK